MFASLYNDRAISYRVHKGFVHADVALSAGVQRMVRSDKGAAGVMFTLDTESGFRDAVFVTSSYGLGETVVQGAVNPDEFYVHKPMLAAGKKAVVRRNIGSKMIKMTFSAEKVAGKSVVTEDVEEALRHQFSINDEDCSQQYPASPGQTLLIRYLARLPVMTGIFPPKHVPLVHQRFSTRTPGTRPHHAGDLAGLFHISVREHLEYLFLGCLLVDALITCQKPDDMPDIRRDLMLAPVVVHKVEYWPIRIAEL